MKILVVEDDDNKLLRLTEYLRRSMPGAKVLVSASLIAGVRAVTSFNPDLTILDMTLPNYDVTQDDDGGHMHIFGGRELLRQIKRRSLPTKVVILTQFETFGKAPRTIDINELATMLQREFPDHYLGTVYYHASIDAWEEELTGILRSVEE